ncbi:PHD finger protein 24-like [Saccoglossus kowalevskii]
MFKDLDCNSDGVVSWWEFMYAEGLKLLFRKRSQRELVEYLQPREIQRMRHYFRQYDNGNRGIITKKNARQAFHRWCQDLGLSLPPSKSCTIMADSTDPNANRLISWEVFLRDNALSVISTRPNATDTHSFLVTEDMMHDVRMQAGKEVWNKKEFSSQRMSTFKW